MLYIGRFWLHETNVLFLSTATLEHFAVCCSHIELSMYFLIKSVGAFAVA